MEVSTGRRALITTLFTRSDNRPLGQSEKYAYVKDFGQGLKCVIAGRMERVKTCKTLPSNMFGKRKGPFVKLQPAKGWIIVESNPNPIGWSRIIV